MESNNYLNDRESRALHAIQHTNEMYQYFGEYIRESAVESVIYTGALMTRPVYVHRNQSIEVKDLDSVSAVMKYATKGAGKTAVLNFSSYKNPGGRFLDGSMAQEECLCHSSYLYNVLKLFENSYYAENRAMLNRGMYTDRALYTPGVAFMQNGDVTMCDVLTCAAPNFSVTNRYKTVSREENAQILLSRVKFLLDVAVSQNVDNLILGAFGCGVFKQDPVQVAVAFRELLTTTHKCFNKVVFAIPAGKNLEAFEEVFSDIMQ